MKKVKKGKNMISISLCMIVKNEEKVLERCLNSVKNIVDEIIIVDTGSTDSTKEIASRYTNKIFDFQWIDDFSAARNFAFSKATMDYIYSADADELIDEENQEKFLNLKKCLLPEIEIVQMKYSNQLQFGTVYNFDEEYRPKLFKRLRTFSWMEPIHETIEINPVIYDSEIVILHLPENSHANRDFRAFLKQIENGNTLSERLRKFYVKELFIAGNERDFFEASSFFENCILQEELGEDSLKECCCVVAKNSRLLGDYLKFFKYAMKAVALGSCSEICCELGEYYYVQEDFEESIIWFYNACYETEAIINIKSKFNIPLSRLADCYAKLGDEKLKKIYLKELDKYNNSYQE